MLLRVNKSLLALTVVAGTLLTGCNDSSPDPKSTNPTDQTNPIVKPDAPTTPITNDDLDQFGWTWSNNFNGKQFYEIKVQDQEWTAVNGNPHQLAIDAVYAIGEIQVRVKADSATNRSVSDALVNTSPYTGHTGPLRPAAPTNPLQNDALNTFDWTFVSGFNSVSYYEYSLTGGRDWLTVVDKPLMVGDVDIDAGQVQVRVKENVATGTAAGAALISTQAFTAGVPIVIDAPTLPNIVNVNIGNTGYPYEIKTNGFSWEWVAGYDKPEYYEFTNDGGVTWQAVTSKPQHVGPKAYDKTKVGVRVKRNAISNQVNPAGQVLFAAAASENFYVTRVVSMKAWNQAQDLTSTGNWSKADDDGCYIEYDVNGENPQFWAYAGGTSTASNVAKLLKTEFCNMPNWSLVDITQMTAKTLVDSSFVASTFSGYLISDSQYDAHWASETKNDVATLKKISAGKEITTSYKSAKAIQSWTLPEIADIVAESKTVNTDIQASVLLHDGKWKTTSTDIITVINDVDALSDNPLSPLLSDVQALETKTKTTFDALELELANYKERLGLLALYSTMLENDTSVDNSIKVKIKENTALANAEFIKFTALHTSFFTGLKVSSALTALIQLTDQNIAANTTRDELIAAGDGAIIHAKSLDLFAAASTISDFIKANIKITADLKAATDELSKEDNTALFSALNKLWVMFNDLPTSADVDALNTVAEAGLKRASDAGYEVAAADAVVGTHFYKLDMNGDYLPSATTYAQGWRCVMDNRDLVRKRIWTLLKDGLPNGADDLAFDASGAGIASVMGAGGLVESTNTAQLCGRNDWSLPTKGQLTSLETGTVNNKATIDVDVFPHHFALKPEYDINDWLSGAPDPTLFWYWTKEERNSDEQKIYRYETQHKSAASSSALKQGNEDKVVQGRVVSEITLSYQLLDSAGSVTTDVDAAVCAYQPETKKTWQLFDNADLATRAKYYGQSNLDAGTVLAEVAQRNTEKLCNKSNWQVPSLAQLEMLLPMNDSVFRQNTVEKYDSQLCYVTADSAQYERQKCLNMVTESTSDVNKSNSYSGQYVYRLMSVD